MCGNYVTYSCDRIKINGVENLPIAWSFSNFSFYNLRKLNIFLISLIISDEN